MKKRIFFSLIVGISLFATSVSNAGEFNSAKFEQQYPNTAKSVKVYVKANKASAQSLALSGFGYTYFKSSDVENHPQQVVHKLEQCSAGFDNPTFPVAIQHYLATNFSADELKQIEDYFASSAGQKEMAYTKQYTQHRDLKLILAGKNPDMLSATEFESQSGKDGEKMRDFALSKIGEKYREAIFNDKDPDIDKPMNDLDNCLEKAKVNDYVKL